MGGLAHTLQAVPGQPALSPACCGNPALCLRPESRVRASSPGSVLSLAGAVGATWPGRRELGPCPFSQPAWAVPPACCSQVLPLPGCCAQGPRCASLEPESSSVPPLLAVPRAPPAWGSLHSCEAVRPLDRDRPLCPVALGSEGPVIRHSSQLGVPGAASHTARAGTPGAGLRPPAQRRWA